MNFKLFLIIVLFFLVKSSAKSKYRFSNSEWLHFAPFVLISIVVAVLAYGFHIRLYFSYIRPIFLLQGLIYVALIFRFLKGNKGAKALNKTKIFKLYKTV
jgi:hypothetical protein